MLNLIEERKFMEFTVNVSKAFLLESLKKNKEAHIKDYELAAVQYFKKLQEVLSGLSEDAKLERFRKDAYSIEMPPPQNKSKKYDKFITMLEQHTDDYITISADEYDKFVNDDWEWVRYAKSLNTSYSSQRF